MYGRTHERVLYIPHRRTTQREFSIYHTGESSLYTTQERVLYTPHRRTTHEGVLYTPHRREFSIHHTGEQHMREFSIHHTGESSLYTQERVLYTPHRREFSIHHTGESSLYITFGHILNNFIIFGLTQIRLRVNSTTFFSLIFHVVLVSSGFRIQDSGFKN